MESNQHTLNSDVLNKIINTQCSLASAGFDFEEFMRLIVNEIQSLTPATGAVVELVEGKDMVYRAASGTVAQHVGLRMARQGSISGLCVETNEILCSDDTEKDTRVNIEACRRVQARSLVVAPLVHEGKVLGVLKILSGKAKGFQPVHIKTLQIMAGFIASGLANQLHHQYREYLLRERNTAIAELKKTQQYLKKLAHYDYLTGLYNRSYFIKELELLLEKKFNTSLVLMYMDIDDFKSINDNYGHDTGDRLLKIFAKRLKQCVRAQDITARLGGDEFILLLKNVQSKQNVFAVAEKIIQKMQAKFSVGNTVMHISVSIGIAFQDQKESLSARDFIKKADEGLYQAKNAGKNRYCMYHPAA